MRYGSSNSGIINTLCVQVTGTQVPSGGAA